MGSTLESNCIFSICLEQLEVPDKCCFTHRKQGLTKSFESQPFPGFSGHEMTSNDSYRNYSMLFIKTYTVGNMLPRALSNILYFTVHAVSAVD